MSGHRDRGNGRQVGTSERRRGGLSLSRVRDTQTFELVHPRCVLQRKADYQEGIELWEAGDPEGAKDALRFALEGCGDNLWVHVALGRIALEADRDPELARGHFGYAYELVERVLKRPSFDGRLPRTLPGNAPFFDAAEGLAACYEALGRPQDAQEVRRKATRLAGLEGG